MSRHDDPAFSVSNRSASDPLPGRRAPIGRRVLSVAVDWFIASVASYLLFDWHAGAVTLIFAGLNIVFLTLFGATPGQMVVGSRVVSVAGRMPMVVRALLRTLLLCLIIPVAIVDDADRGLHDRAAGTAVRMPIRH